MSGLEIVAIVSVALNVTLAILILALRYFTAGCLRRINMLVRHRAILLAGIEALSPVHAELHRAKVAAEDPE